MKNFDQFINLHSYYNLNLYKKEEKCGHCDFILSLQFIYVQNLIDYQNIEDLKTFC